MSDYRHTHSKDRCKEGVYIKDVLRRTGRGPSGFEMHYNYDQCHRKPTHRGYCWQHKPCAEPTCNEKPSYKKGFCWEHH